MSEVINIGNPKGLGFRLEWIDHSTSQKQTAADVTLGKLNVFVDSYPLWQEQNGSGVEWTWIELLEYFTWQWKYLKYEEAIEFTQLNSIKNFREFNKTHDISNALDGIMLPNLSIIRSGNLAYIESDGFSKYIDWKDTIDSLEKIGNEIEKRLDIVPDDPRTIEIKGDWAKRNQVKTEEINKIYLESDPQYIDIYKNIHGDESFITPAENDCILAVGRFSKGKLLQSDWERLLKDVRIAEKKVTQPNPILDKLSDSAIETLNEYSDSPPFEQGYKIASVIRKKLFDSGNQEVGIEKIITDVLNIRLILKEYVTFALDAIAIWPKNGICIILNTKGIHSSTEGGRNATLAHELCHILVDRNGALPLADVVGGRMPEFLEKRARAFAAEWLLPSEEIQKICPLFTVKKMSMHIASLARKYKASQELVTWQLLNFGRRTSLISSEVCITLENIANKKLKSVWDTVI